MDEYLEKWVKKFIKRNEESSFSRFIIQEMGFPVEAEKKVDDETRKDAFSEFGKRTAYKKIAALQTMKRWFGLDGFSTPSRDTLFEICFALKLDGRETERYLMQGIFEPAFQVNDYTEAFYFYGLENGIPYEEILEMIFAFEDILAERFFQGEDVTDLSFSTQELKKELYSVKTGSKERFMLWMRDHANLFKGYSQTTQNYLEKLRRKIYEDSVEDIKDLLESRLTEIGYYRWASQHAESYDTQGEAVRVYLKVLKKRKKQSLSDMEYKNILEMVRLVYAPKETNAKMFELLFHTKTKNLPYLSEKHLSDLFHVPFHKIFLKKIRLVEVTLGKLPEEKACPVEVLPYLAEIDKTYSGQKQYSVGEALKIIRQYEKKENRRTMLLHREELLPVIYYVVQGAYAKSEALRTKMTAKEYFSNYGNSILNVCGLEEINENYRLDALLCACLNSGCEYDYQDILAAVKSLEQEMENNSVRLTK